jgi:hypothetical protein
MSTKVKLLLVSCGTLLLGGLAISNQSLWIDEGGAAMKAIQPTLGDWWHALRAENTSNLQLLLHLSYLWAWVKIFGVSEIALRAANLPFVFAGLVGAVWGLQRWPARQFWCIALASVNAFTWYYTNEARPYMLLFGASCWALACLARAYDNPEACSRSRVWFVTFCSSLFFVSATSLVALPWAAVGLVCGIFLLGWRRSITMVGRQIIPSLIWLAAIALLGGYYFWTLRIGAKPSNVGRTGLANLFYIIYEQVGLAGLGPGRTELRSGNIQLLGAYAIPLSIGILVLLMPAWEVIRALTTQLRSNRFLAVPILATAFPVIVVLGAGWLTDARILGRHLTPLYPLVLFALALAVERLLARNKVWATGAVAALLVVLAFSSLQIRFASRHARDDYRAAAAVAKSHARENKSVWWVADDSTARYYGVRFADHDATGGIISLRNPTREQLDALSAPNMIVFSKPDIHDGYGTVQQFARRRGFAVTSSLQAFQLLEPQF